MPSQTEIERKFLVRRERLPELPAPERIEQGYLCVEPAVRVRLTESEKKGREAELTIKGKGLLSRSEFSYRIPVEDAEAILGLCERALRKERHRLGRWEIDRFLDVLDPAGGPLWLAEIELASEDEPYEQPAWLGPEVTSDPGYANARLARPWRSS